MGILSGIVGRVAALEPAFAAGFEVGVVGAVGEVSVSVLGPLVGEVQEPWGSGLG